MKTLDLLKESADNERSICKMAKATESTENSR